MKYAINTTAIILFINNRNIRIEKTDQRYPKIINVFKLDSSEQEQAVLDIIDEKSNYTKVIKSSEGFEIITNSAGEDEIWFNDEKLPPALSEKILSIIAEDLPLDHFEKFWNNLKENPSATSVNELIDFLSNKELPITDDGHFIAYKGVRDDYFSIHGNKDTKVLTGVVDEHGKILNNIGSYISVARNQVDDDRNRHCSYGLHCGQLEYSRSFGSKIVVVKVNPKDVVSVPSDHSFMKCRVSAYEVVSEYTEELLSSVVDSNGQDTIKQDPHKILNSTIDKIANYLKKKREQNYSEVSIRQIQNIFSPGYATKVEVLNALQSLGETWYTDSDYGIDLVILD